MYNLKSAFSKVVGERHKQNLETQSCWFYCIGMTTFDGQMKSFHHPKTTTSIEQMLNFPLCWHMRSTWRQRCIGYIPWCVQLGTYIGMYFLHSWGQSGLNTDAIFLLNKPLEHSYEIIPSPISTRKGDNHAALDTASDSPSSGSIPFHS